MRLLVDECTGPGVARWLREQGHDVYSVPDQSPGWDDADIVAFARTEQRIIVSNDKDFGELIFKNRLSHAGVILMRLEDERPANKISILNRFLNTFQEEITRHHFIVLTEKAVRINLNS